MFRKLLLLILALLINPLITVNAQEADNLVKMSLSLFNKGDQKYLAVSLLNKEKWHTYWKNPGSAGKPVEIKFEDIEVEELEWPAPKLYREAGGLIAYGYSSEYTFFFKLKNIPSTKFKVNGTWLICKDICIPGNKSLEAKIANNMLIAKNDFTTNDKLLKSRFEHIPQVEKWPKNLDIKLVKGVKPNTLKLEYTHQKPFLNDEDHNLLTPFPTFLITFDKELLTKQDSQILGTLPLEWDGEYEDPEIPLPTDGKFQTPIEFQFIYIDPLTKKPVVIKKSIKEFLNNSEQKLVSAGTVKKKPELPPPSNSLLIYLFLAFLGGLILNIMPCVLPVISLKLFNLASHSDESKRAIFKHNLFYTLGVLFTFIVLAIIVLTLKASGESVGWGFQLQSPYFVSIMAIFLFILSLNLFGLFEFRTPGGKTLGNVQLKKGFVGDFFGGVLATILSTPCSAPVLGSALTFAFTSGKIEIFIIFITIGLGLAFPFILTGIFPQLIKFLPRPGMWMENVKKFLGLTMLITVVWLLDVFNSLTDLPLAYTKINIVLLFVFFAFYFDNKIGKKKTFKVIFYLAPILLFINLIATEITTSHGNQDPLLKEKLRNGLNWQSWSEETMSELKGEFVFIDFTAKWCLTCKVNEKLVLETEEFKGLVKENNIKLLLADWTKRDPHIETFLKRYGHVGVPVYFIQKKNGELIDLGETISISEIKNYLK